MPGVHEVGEVDADTARLERAAEGDQSAWRSLVDEHSAVVWAVARVCSWSVADAEDLYQAAWLILAENLEQVRDQNALAGWLSTTVRREAQRLAKARRREPPAGLSHTVTENLRPQDVDSRDCPENQALRAMLASRLWQEFGELPQRCQQLLRVVAVAPEASYAEVSEAMGIPRGSIGPKKNRCLVLLRRRMGTLVSSEEVAG